MTVARGPGQPMASRPSLRGHGHSRQGRYGCAEGALGREPPGRVFWSGGLGPWAPGTRREATALTAWLRGSAKDRHCLSVGPHYPLPDWGWMSLLTVSLQGPRKGNHSYLPQMLPELYLFFLLTAREVGAELLYESGNSGSAMLSDLTKATRLESGRAWT